MIENEITEEKKRIMEEDPLEFFGHQRAKDQDERIVKMKILNDESINQ